MLRGDGEIRRIEGNDGKGKVMVWGRIGILQGKWLGIAGVRCVGEGSICTFFTTKLVVKYHKSSISELPSFLLELNSPLFSLPRVFPLIYS